MHFLAVLLGLVALITSVAAASFPKITPSLKFAPKMCSQYAKQITKVKKSVARPTTFCNYYLSRARTRSPITGFTHTQLAQTCACMLLKSRQKIPKTQKLAAAQKTPKGGYKCNTKYLTKVKKEFVDSKTFCNFYGALARDMSPVSGLNVVQVTEGCVCLNVPQKPVSKTSTTAPAITTPSAGPGSTAPGSAGSSGSPGSAGSNGSSGSNGSTGSAGSSGSNGSSGSSGSSGSNGSTGSAGSSGSSGSNGSTGSAGSSGSSGANGSSGTNGSNGSNGANGANGSNGSNGSTGANGSDGANGSNGSNGSSGSNGSGTGTGSGSGSTGSAPTGSGSDGSVSGSAGAGVSVGSGSGGGDVSLPTSAPSVPVTTPPAQNTGLPLGSGVLTTLLTSASPILSNGPTNLPSVISSLVSPPIAVVCPQITPVVSAVNRNLLDNILHTELFTPVFNGVSRAVTGVNTVTTKTYTSDAAFAAVVTDCAKVAVGVQANSVLSSINYNLQYNPLNLSPYNCVVYTNRLLGGSANYAGTDPNVACSYGYEQKGLFRGDGLLGTGLGL